MTTSKNLWEGRVAAGSAFLDERYPGWYWEVDPSRIRMGSCGQCILGQLYGLFNSATVALGIPLRARQYGFIADSRWQYPLLDKLWSRAVTEKRERERFVPPTKRESVVEQEEALVCA